MCNESCTRLDKISKQVNHDKSKESLVFPFLQVPLNIWTVRVFFERIPLVAGSLSFPDVRGRPLLHVGPLKGRHLDDAVRRSSPSLVLELGSYLGYSAVGNLGS